MPAPKNNEKKGPKVKGKCGAAILYLTNGLLLTVGIIGAVLSGLAMLGQGAGYTIAGLEPEDYSEFVPQSFVWFVAGTSGLIVVISFLGFVGTGCQMKENKIAAKEKHEGADASVGGGLGGQGCCSKDACMSCWLDLYILMTFLGLLVLLIASAVGAAALTGVSVSDVEDVVESGCGTVGVDCEGSVSSLLANAYSYLDTWITDNKDGQSWTAAQNALKCCGWWENNGTVSAIANETANDPHDAHCCMGNNSYADMSDLSVVILDTTVIVSNDGICYTDNSGSVYTCGGRIVDFVLSNVQGLAIGTWIFTGLTLICFICACAVRCAIKPMKKKKKIQPVQKNVEPGV